ncbi:MAG: HEAT repeat domain-containing protein [Richelia sp. RM2_1_2]|nr:HEAT repeat domain-containing protein [Richelia sp. SM2_1_7]NJM21818.1 HEAT repeat domain-containing protein [Richelia sp. SM1_7_0]NJN09668.1 HEAT repeat domain-containing protein [Richelia sp. RM1_1_1]NJO27976.1 HEAT repeat domain-containing protein [Richelia sp. SL_2_1]NJO59822.1 HEAT repeat domain-containing protein [Richelia sp. RM2_1_2]
MNEPIFSAETAEAALQSEDNQIRYYAAWWLGKHQVQESCAALCEALFDQRYRIPSGGYPLRRQAARALGQLKNRSAVEALIKACECNDFRLREAAIQALAAIGDRKAVNALLEMMQSDRIEPYEALIEALATFKVDSARCLIEPYLNHASERIQCAAARYFYFLTQESQYLECIFKYLNHENMYVRWAAVFDLGAVAHHQAVEAILTARVPSSLKLLNLKRILETVLDSDTPQQQTSQLIFQAIDDLLIQL